MQDPFFAQPERVRPEPRAATARELVLVALVAFLAALPFLDKAVGQDDWAYLTLGELVADGAAGGGGGIAGLLERETLYQGRPITVGQGIYHGPVWPGLLAACRVFGAERAVPLSRLLAAFFLALLAAAVAGLAARLGAPPVPTGLAAALAPGPLMLAGTAMTDLPMVALFAASLAVAASGMERGSLPRLALAGALGLACALTRYYGAAVVPMLLVQPLLFGRLRITSFLPAFVAAAGFGGWVALSSSLFGQADPARGVAALDEIAGIDHRSTLLAAVCGLGGMASGWLLGALFAPRRLAKAVLGDPLVLVLVLGGLSVGAWLAIEAAALHGFAPAGLNGALQALFLGFGSVLLAGALLPLLDASAWRGGGLAAWRARRGGDAWLALWMAGFVVAATLFVPFGATRYVLPALPAAVLLAALFCVRRLGAGAATAALAASAALGLACAIADENAAGVYARYSEKIGQRRAPGGPWSQTGLWVWGELGFRWYLERDADARVLPSDSNEPVAGDRILHSSICTASTDDGRSGTYPLSRTLLPRMYAEDHEVWRDGWPLRVHNPRSGAGFYHSSAGILPFALSTADHDEFLTWLVKDPSPLLESFRFAKVETLEEPRLPGGNVRVERFFVRPDLPTFPAVKFHFPGRVTWRGVAVPADRPWLTLHVGEHYRLVREALDGPGSIVRVVVGGEVLAELAIDSRRREEDRVWFRLSLDVSRWAGSETTVVFEVEAQEEHAPPAGRPPVTIVGFADPRFSAEPLPKEEELDGDGG
ncbi:MAG: hypothetical protein AAF682_28800 [Planctomycetota bacterium]